MRVEDDPRFKVPEGWVSAEPTLDGEGRGSFWLTSESGIPTSDLIALGKKMDIEVIETDKDLLITFPAPYEYNTRIRWCMNVRELAIHYDVEWPHLTEL